MFVDESILFLRYPMIVPLGFVSTMVIGVAL